MNLKRELQGTNINIYSGFETSFINYEKNFFLRLDISNKIVRTDTILDYINQLYNVNDGKSKEEKRRIVKEELVGRTILANYGTHRYYRIDDVIFDRECSRFMLDDPDDLNIQT